MGRGWENCNGTMFRYIVQLDNVLDEEEKEEGER